MRYTLDAASSMVESPRMRIPKTYWRKSYSADHIIVSQGNDIARIEVHGPDAGEIIDWIIDAHNAYVGSMPSDSVAAHGDNTEGGAA